MYLRLASAATFLARYRLLQRSFPLCVWVGAHIFLLKCACSSQTRHPQKQIFDILLSNLFFLARTRQKNDDLVQGRHRISNSNVITH